MRADLIKIYKSVHTWTGIVSGMALFIAFYAGALTVFKEPLARWVTPPTSHAVVPLAEAQALIVKTLSVNSDAGKSFTLHIEEAEHIPARMAWQVRDPKADDHDNSATRHYLAYLDADGAAQVEASHPSQLGNFIDVLHRVVGLPVDSDENRWIMGVIAILYTLALVSGVIVLLPSLVKDFFALRVGKNLKRMWLDAHNVVGIVSLPFHLVMALTAVVFAYHDGFYALQDKLLHDGKMATAFQRPQTGAPAAQTPPRDLATLLTPQELVMRARALSPGFEPYQLEYFQVTSPRALVRVWGHDGSAVSPRARGGFAAIDPYSGKVVNQDFLPGQQTTPNLIISSIFALHMASFGGTTVQWLYFLLGLAGAWLFYSGNLLWIESRRRRAGKRDSQLPVQRLDTRWLAAATVGVCIGSVCGISLTIVGGKWLYGHVSDLNAWHVTLYYAAFFAAVVWAFWRGAASAVVPLLWSASILTLTIPLTTLAAWSMPSLGLWAHTSAATLGVDATALVGAGLFAWMARATHRRIRFGATDSVWSERGAPELTADQPGELGHPSSECTHLSPGIEPQCNPLKPEEGAIASSVLLTMSSDASQTLKSPAAISATPPSSPSSA